MITLYQILLIAENSSADEIKKAYRKRVMLFHPDINKHPEASKVFISIQNAYEVLSDSEKRREYDKSLEFSRIVKNAQYTHNGTQYSAPQKDTANAANSTSYSRKRGSRYRLLIPIYVLLMFGGPLVGKYINFLINDSEYDRNLNTETRISSGYESDLKTHEEQVDNLKKIYDNMRKANTKFNVPYDQFVKDMQVDENRRKFHSNLPKYAKDFNVSYKQFSKDMGFEGDMPSAQIGGVSTEEDRGKFQDFSNHKEYPLYIDPKSGRTFTPRDEKESIYIEKVGPSKGLRLADEEELAAYKAKIGVKKDINKNEEKHRAQSQSIVELEQRLAITRPQTGLSLYNSFYGAGMVDENSKGSITVVNGTDQDAVAIIYEISTNKIVRNVYIRAGSQYEVQHIPEGILRMKSMYGEKWVSDWSNGDNKPKGGFMENISFSDMASHEKFDMNWDVYSDGIDYPIYTITLHKVKDGNLQTKSINKNIFF